MGFKSAEQIRDIIEGGFYSCGIHGFVCDLLDKESIQKHETEFQHQIKGTAPCVRCGTEVKFTSLPKPKEGMAPGALCTPCRDELLAQVGGNE